MEGRLERSSKIVELEVAISNVKNDMTIGVGGWILHNIPMIMLREIAKRKVKNLKLIAMQGGMIGDFLAGSNVIDTIFSSYIGMEWLTPVGNNFRRKAENGDINILECDEFHVIAALRAALERVPFYPTRVGIGTDIVKVNPLLKEFVDPIKGEKFIAVPAIEPDVALIHGGCADKYGNVQHPGAIFLDSLLARASKLTIVSVEKIIDGNLDPRLTTIPCNLVDYIIVAPYGCHPCSSHGFYNYDEESLMEYIGSSKNQRNFEDYLNRYVYNISSFEEYLDLIGRERLEKLKSDVYY
jgi:glutaconate CoA-transferase subunit A